MPGETPAAVMWDRMTRHVEIHKPELAGTGRMMVDLRETSAPYYDLNPMIPDDVAFYRARLPSADAMVLELGCGTGRVLLPLVASCGAIHGIDTSEAMLTICRQKLHAAAIPPTKAQVEVGDITNFHLGRTFDLIIAPYRVFQLLDTETQVDGLFRCVRAHLASGGTCILNVVHPRQDPERLRQEWCTQAERLRWEVTIAGDRIRGEWVARSATHSCRLARIFGTNTARPPMSQGRRVRP